MRAFNSDVDGRLAVAVGLANASRAGAGGLATTEDVDAVFVAHGYVAPQGEAERDGVRRLGRRLEVLLGQVVEADAPEAVELVNGLLARCDVRPHLEARHGAVQLHFHPAHATFVEGWAGGIAGALAIDLSDDGACRVGRCAADGCARYFLDRGRNRQRRFCSLRCQNRIKSAAYRRRANPAG